MSHIHQFSKRFFAPLAGCIVILLGMTQCDDNVAESAERLLIESVITDASEFGASDGSIQLVLSGGEEPFAFFWGHGENTQNVSGLNANSYDVRIVYGKNGQHVTYASFEVGQPDQAPFFVPATIDSASYPTANDGGITIQVSEISGGTPPYKVTWDSGDTLSFRLGLFAGVYSATITDSSPEPFQRSTTTTFSVFEPDFLCGRDSIIDIDGNRYATVSLDGNCWMSQNLRTSTHPTDSTAIAQRFCEGSNCEGSEGAHYSWDAIVGPDAPGDSTSIVQGICPLGWHVPTAKEWVDLESFLLIEGNGGAGTNAVLKISGEDSPSGFNALPTGFFGYDLQDDLIIGDIGFEATEFQKIFWSSTATNATSASAIGIGSDEVLSASFNKSLSYNKAFGICLRCVEDSGQ